MVEHEYLDDPPLTYSPEDYRWVAVRRRPRLDGWTEEKQRRFVETLADTGLVSMAAKAVGMTRESAYKLRRAPHATAFAHAWDAARHHAGSVLEDMAFERALEGIEQNVFDEFGQVVCTKRVYSNRLLTFLLSHLKPERYGRAAQYTQAHIAQAQLAQMQLTPGAIGPGPFVPPPPSAAVTPPGVPPPAMVPPGLHPEALSGQGPNPDPVPPDDRRATAPPPADALPPAESAPPLSAIETKSAATPIKPTRMVQTLATQAPATQAPAAQAPAAQSLAVQSEEGAAPPSLIELRPSSLLAPPLPPVPLDAYLRAMEPPLPAPPEEFLDPDTFADEIWIADKFDGELSYGLREQRKPKTTAQIMVEATAALNARGEAVCAKLDAKKINEKLILTKQEENDLCLYMDPSLRHVRPGKRYK